MERQRIPTDAGKLWDIRYRASMPDRDRNVVKMAEMILMHFPYISSDAAYALLRSAAKLKT